MQGTGPFLIALRLLGWSGCGIDDPRAFSHPGHPPSPSGCYLDWAHRHQNAHRNLLNDLGERAIGSLVQTGMRLHERWPGSTGELATQWIGQRFYFFNAHHVIGQSRFGSIVSSQLGRNNRRMPHWPRLLDWAFQSLRRDHSCVLLVNGTTMYEPTVEFAKVIDLDAVEMVLPKFPVVDEQRIAVWLRDVLGRATIRGSGLPERNQVYLSPEWGSSIVHPELSEFPLRDRVAISLADRVMALAIRPNGNIAGLLERRLADGRYPRGTIFVAIEQLESKPVRSMPEHVSAWLDQGAVGWVILRPSPLGLASLSRCTAGCPGPRSSEVRLREPQLPKSSTRTMQQVCAPLACLVKNRKSEWPYLAHCTRGTTGRYPQESEASYYRRLWHAGHDLPSHPLVTLIQILREGRLRSTVWMTRGKLATVSLTEVPLGELLSRRQFKSHLGRWDWEPYGFLFRKESLPQAKPVVYRRSADYNRMSRDQQAYFQPSDSKYDWSQEREWRVVGDLDLKSLPTESVIVFVRSRVEAMHLTRESRFPVFWIESNSL